MPCRPVYGYQRSRISTCFAVTHGYKGPGRSFDLYSSFFNTDNKEWLARLYISLRFLPMSETNGSLKKISAPVEKNMNTWSGRFSEPVSELVQRYTASVSFDRRLAEYDIQGSLLTPDAHSNKHY